MSAPLRPDVTIEVLNHRTEGFLPGWFGLRVVALTPGRLEMQMPLQPQMLAPNGFLHAASIIALADTAAGFATIAHLPEGAESFTTLELKTNFFATQTTGVLTCVTSAVHTGRTTHVWDSDVTGEGGRRLALFRCTQLVLWPKKR
jgi:1,4-dihydroxy-2-naphthoyl-CoA hydrolase